MTVEIPPASKSPLGYEPRRVLRLITTGIGLIEDEIPWPDTIAMMHIAGERLDDTYVDEIIAISGPQAIGMVSQLNAALLRHYDRRALIEVIGAATRDVLKQF